MTSAPENFARYKVEKVLGEGAMGIVYEGYDPGIGRKVAIKTIHAHLLQGKEGEDLQRRFTQEVKAVGRLSHPNIVAIYDSGETPNPAGVVIPSFFMEFVTGQELQYYLDDGARFPLAKVIDIACQILEAFAYTHPLGVIHRDVKPANIFMTDTGKVKIADFGIARVDNTSMTQTGAITGTPNYMSPEQCSGQAIDARSDLFSIAIVLYELLTGEKPFSANSVHATMLKVLQTHPEAPSAFNPALPKSLDAIMAKALAKAPDDRFQSAEDFLKAIEPFKHGRAASPALDATQKVSPVSAQKKSSSSKLPLFGALAAVLLLILVGAYVWWQSGTAVQPELAGQSTGDAIPPPVEIKPFATNLPHETQEKVERLLKVAATHEQAERLIFPPTSSAYYVYNLVFEMDPGNPRAQNGLRLIGKKLEAQAQEYYRNRDFETLAAHLQGSLAVFPENQVLLELQQKLTGLQGAGQ